MSPKPAAKKTSKKTAKPTAKKIAKRPAPPSRVPAPVKSTVYHRIHAVLHSVRIIAHFEDALCALLEHVKTAGNLDSDAAQELGDLLERLPSHLYLDDLEALRAALPAPAAAVAKKPAKRAASKRPGAKSRR